MADFEMDFEWPVAKYEIKQPEPLPTTGILGSLNEGKFSPVSLISIANPRMVRPSTTALDKTVYLLAIPELRSFEHAVTTAANALGMLSSQSNVGATEPLSDWKWLSDAIRLTLGAEQYFVHNAASAGFQLGELGLFVVPGKRREASLSFRPRTLRDAIVFHAARKAATGTRLIGCPACKTLFLSGGARTKGTKISGSKFCSDDCRYDFNNARRKRRAP